VITKKATIVALLTILMMLCLISVSAAEQNVEEFNVVIRHPPFLLN